MGERLKRWLPAVLWMAVIFYLSSRSAIDIPGFLGDFDKLQHIAAYMLLGFLVFRGCVKWRQPYAAAFAISAVYGITDELHQRFVPGRFCDFRDWLSDAGGIILALIITFIFLRIRRDNIGGEKEENQKD